MNFAKLSEFKRINVIGTSGSGKSTFARRISELLEAPYCEMDQLFWKPYWTESSDDELLAKIRDATAGEKWVLDGNYTRTTPEKWKRVQLVIWLDLSFVRTIFRVTKRAIHQAITREELWTETENRGSLAKAFLSKESIIWFAIRTHRPNKPKYSTVLNSQDRYPHITFVRLTSPKEMALFID